MKKNYFLIILLLTFFVSPVKSQTNGADIWIQDKFSVGSDTIEYRLFLPANYDSTVQYPLIYVFPGINWGNTADYFAASDNTVPGISFAEPVNQKNNPCIILMPGLLGGGTFWWDPKVDVPLNGLADFIEKHYSVDQNRLYVTGFSLGGFETYIGIHFNKGRFAAAIPLSSGYAYHDSVKVFKDAPLWSFHGQTDTTNPVGDSRVIMENYEKLGSKVIYTHSNYRKEINLNDDQIKNHILAHSNPFYSEVPGEGHSPSFWTQSYNTPLLQQWLFSKYKLKPGAIKLSNLIDPKVYPVLSESYSIHWNSEYPADSVEIWFSPNAGDSWELIQSQLNDGNFDWDVSKVQDCSLGKIRILLKNSLGFVYCTDESSLFAINNPETNSAPVIKILTQDFTKNYTIAVARMNLQLLIADAEKDSVTVKLKYSCNNGLYFNSFDIFKVSAQIDTITKVVDLTKLNRSSVLILKAEISDGVSGASDTTVFFYNTRGKVGDCPPEVKDPLTYSLELNNENAEITIYPNPFTDELTIQAKGDKDYSVELLTITGRILYQSKMFGNLHRINLSELSNGIYFVRMKSNNFVSVRKVIKQ